MQTLEAPSVMNASDGALSDDESVADTEMSDSASSSDEDAPVIVVESAAANNRCEQHATDATAAIWMSQAGVPTHCSAC